VGVQFDCYEVAPTVESFASHGRPGAWNTAKPWGYTSRMPGDAQHCNLSVFSANSEAVSLPRLLPSGEQEKYRRYCGSSSWRSQKVREVRRRRDSYGTEGISKGESWDASAGLPADTSTARHGNNIQPELPLARSSSGSVRRGNTLATHCNGHSNQVPGRRMPAFPCLRQTPRESSRNGARSTGGA
jgi:hypothetical protein